MMFNTPSIRFSLQSLCTRLADIPQSSAASCAVTYSNISVLLKLYCIYHSRLNELYQFIKHEFLSSDKKSDRALLRRQFIMRKLFLNGLRCDSKILKIETRELYAFIINNEHLLDYDKCGLIKTGDVIGCSVTDIENIPGYDVLCEKGVKFVNREIIKNTLSFKAGENEWAEVQISGQSHCITIIATPNHTGKERILSIGLDAIYLQASVFPFLDNAIRIIQPAE